MKIAVTSQGPDLNSPVDPRFGRCQYFIIIDTDTMEYEAISNPALNATGGAGVQAAQLVVSKGVRAVLTGEVGPNAEYALSSAGVQIIRGVSGTVLDAVNFFKTQATGTVPPGIQGPGGFGGGMGPGGGFGPGGGKGMGFGGRRRGKGRGFGGGRGRGAGRGKGWF